jgi:hypothetical protein
MKYNIINPREKEKEMGDKFIYVVMEDGEFSACFATLEAAQKFCAESWEQDVASVLIVEVPVHDIFTYKELLENVQIYNR